MCVWQDVVITELSSSAYLWTPKISENFALIWHLAEGKHHHGYGSWFVIRPISVIGPIPDIHSIDTTMLVLNAWCHRLYPIRYHGTYRIRRIFPFWMYWSFCGQWMGIENISFWYPDAIAARSNSNGWFGERSATISVKELAKIYREKKNILKSHPFSMAAVIGVCFMWFFTFRAFEFHLQSVIAVSLWPFAQDHIYFRWRGITRRIVRDENKHVSQMSVTSRSVWRFF